MYWELKEDPADAGEVEENTFAYLFPPPLPTLATIEAWVRGQGVWQTPWALLPRQSPPEVFMLHKTPALKI